MGANGKVGEMTQERNDTGAKGKVGKTTQGQTGKGVKWPGFLNSE